MKVPFRQRGKLGDLGRLDRAALHDGRFDRERRRRLGKRRQRFRQQHGVVARVGNRRGAHEVLRERLERRALHGAPGQRILDDLVARLRHPQLPAQIGDLRHVQAAVVEQDGALRPFESALECVQLGFGDATPLQPWLVGAGGIALLALALNTGSALPIYWSLVFGSGRRLDRLREAWAGYWSLFRGLVLPACALFGIVVFRLLAAG